MNNHATRVGQIPADGPGAIGSAAVQLLKSPGACVTAVCATENVELVKGLDAGRGIDYTAGDLTSPACRPDRARTYGVCGRRLGVWPSALTADRD
jgi:hypothetical protein